MPPMAELRPLARNGNVCALAPLAYVYHGIVLEWAEENRRRTFRRLAARSHPDVQSGSKESFQRVVEATTAVAGSL